MYKTESLWIVNKPIRLHYDQIIPQSVNWEAVHRLDFETSGCLIFAPPDQISKLRERIKLSRGVKKLYLAGASKELPPENLGHVKGFVGSRYRSSKQVRFDVSDKNFRGYHSVVSCEHSLEKISPKKLEELYSKTLTPESKAQLQDLFKFAYQVTLVTGARHQIRSYFKSCEAPLKGDPVYNPGDHDSSRMALHAYSLEIQFESGDPPLKVEAPLEL